MSDLVKKDGGCRLFDDAETRQSTWGTGLESDNNTSRRCHGQRALERPPSGRATGAFPRDQPCTPCQLFRRARPRPMCCLTASNGLAKEGRCGEFLSVEKSRLNETLTDVASSSSHCGPCKYRPARPFTRISPRRIINVTEYVVSDLRVACPCPSPSTRASAMSQPEEDGVGHAAAQKASEDDAGR